VLFAFCFTRILIHQKYHRNSQGLFSPQSKTERSNKTRFQKLIANDFLDFLTLFIKFNICIKMYITLFNFFSVTVKYVNLSSRASNYKYKGNIIGPCIYSFVKYRISRIVDHLSSPFNLLSKN
jgi:hypothetical protein